MWHKYIPNVYFDICLVILYAADVSLNFMSRTILYVKYAVAILVGNIICPKIYPQSLSFKYALIIYSITNEIVR